MKQVLTYNLLIYRMNLVPSTKKYLNLLNKTIKHAKVSCSTYNKYSIGVIGGGGAQSRLIAFIN